MANQRQKEKYSSNFYWVEKAVEKTYIETNSKTLSI